jgi:hypothetical protein
MLMEIVPRVQSFRHANNADSAGERLNCLDNSNSHCKISQILINLKCL